MSTTDRAGYITGLRALADLLEQHDELPVPYDVTAQWICASRSKEEQRAIAQTFTRVMPGTIRKGVRDDAFALDGKIGPVNFGLIVSRDAVCQRVVTDVTEVTREVPDPEALAAVPMVTVTETVEQVNWICSPLLAEVAAQVSA
jgi:hypothetical protein